MAELPYVTSLTQFAILVAQVLTLVTVIGFGIRLMRYITNIEFKVEVMWKEFGGRYQEIIARVQEQVGRSSSKGQNPDGPKDVLRPRH